MNIGNTISQYINNYASSASNVSTTEKVINAYKDNSKNDSYGNTDIVEISSDGYEMQSKANKLSATSGQDKLGITQGENPNSYVIHFDNIALAHRAVERGYITVNGQDIQLSDEVKKKILETSQKAFEASEKATMQYAMQHNSIVARQQAEAWGEESKRMSRAMSVMSKIASGGKVSEADRKFLAEYNPEMYAMAISAEMMSGRQEKQEEKHLSEIREESKEQIPTEDYAKELGELKHEYTEATLEVSFDNGNAVVGEVGTNTFNY